ncbi:MULTISPECIES: antitoxin [unclassified Streptomyces]|uniref:antitoxin n=1 Tax=unclassified Streptomyces TaxID=2593676 RepID=UPI000364CC0C|nr:MULTISPECIES: antitoxin [unclassified Streptomyces]MYX32108.1 antitoxin [Streptomyces sp. SID8377]
MSMFDKIKAKLKGHESQAQKGIDKGGDMLDDKTGGKYQRQVDSAQDKMGDEFGTGGTGEDRPPHS